ncbi:MAG: imidazoleglycerol-phosphate dehydratase HisB [Desulforegulaceae bacterium]|nr:imidazoleglycerol-phosphate dehydratase HisB [Desulforegulaceae bacterium]
MERKAEIKRTTNETDIHIVFGLGGKVNSEISTGIPFFDHMLNLFTVHGGFDLKIKAKGDIEIDNHHTVEDIGIALGEAFKKAIGDKKGIARYGNFFIPMDETLANIALDISNRPYLVFNIPEVIRAKGPFSPYLAKEFFRAFAVHSGITLHINVPYGENEHHILEAIFKGFGKSLSMACKIESDIIPSTKGVL